MIIINIVAWFVFVFAYEADAERLGLGNKLKQIGVPALVFWFDAAMNVGYDTVPLVRLGQGLGYLLLGFLVFQLAVVAQLIRREYKCRA